MTWLIGQAFISDADDLADISPTMNVPTGPTGTSALIKS